MRGAAPQPTRRGPAQYRRPPVPRQVPEGAGHARPSHSLPPAGRVVDGDLWHHGRRAPDARLSRTAARGLGTARPLEGAPDWRGYGFHLFNGSTASIPSNLIRTPHLRQRAVPRYPSLNPRSTSGTFEGALKWRRIEQRFPKSQSTAQNEAPKLKSCNAPQAANAECGASL